MQQQDLDLNLIEDMEPDAGLGNGPWPLSRLLP